MPSDALLDEIRRYVGAGEVAFFSRDQRSCPAPTGLDLPVDVESPKGWDGDLASVHADDRTLVITTFKQAWGSSGADQETQVRVRSGGGWVRCRLRFLNLLGRAPVDAMLRVVDQVERLEVGELEVHDPPRDVPWVRMACDFEGTITSVEGMPDAIYGVTAEALIGRSALELVPPEESPSCIDAGLRAFSEPGVDITHTHRVLGPHGRTPSVEATIRAPDQADGQWRLTVRDAEGVLSRELRDALRDDQFALVYQAVVDVDTGRITGAEALLRWHHPRRGVVPPLSFIPQAEISGMIVDLGAWVLRTACAEAATWPGHLHLAVNLSVRQLADPDVVATVQRALDDTGFPARRLVLEVTESALMEEPERSLRHLEELKALGVRLAIDDFGTGYSSLLYLKRMPVDIIKVDRTFVSGLGEDPGDGAIVASVVSLAHAFGLQAVGEGVETTSQQDHLRALGCDLGQGYLWSPPVPAPRFLELVADQLTTAGL